MSSEHTGILFIKAKTVPIDETFRSLQDTSGKKCCVRHHQEGLRND